VSGERRKPEKSYAPLQPFERRERGGGDDRLKSSESPRICVVGCGYWGSKLVHTFARLGHLAAIYDPDSVRTLALRERGLAAGIHARWNDVLDDRSVDAVAIATPAAMHFEVARDSLRAGKDVFVEKPLSLRVEEGEELVRLAEEGKRILMVGHLLLYHPAISTLKELIEGGELGQIEYVYSNRLNLGKIRREENALWSFAPHDVSVILYLLGALPLEVTAVGGSYLQPNVPDVTVSTMLFAHGVRAHIFVSWLHPYKEQRLVVVGRKKIAVFDDIRQEHKLVTYGKAIELVNGEFVAHKPPEIPVPIAAAEPLRLECEHFLHCIKTRQAPRTDGREGLRVLRVLQACQHSLDLNGRAAEVYVPQGVSRYA
jgi:UDP-2-acetamido-3-amino-2,3-dideoxy-glucuronate N-acetyltransferase